MNVRIEASWQEALKDVFDSESFAKLISFVKDEYSSANVFPEGRDIFNAFDYCPLDQVKVVILGQDPYHGPGQAHGLSFSVKPGVPFPPSLQNIFKEIQSDLGKEFPENGDLTRWAKQGVFLLNAALTVRAHQAGSHQNRGWEEFTDQVIKTISDSRQHVVFMLWGAFAQKKVKLINQDRHLVLKAPHPSPLSSYRGFFGCKHFSQANSYLLENGRQAIDW
ncbi:uracil-DNA glycosylase [Algoriphagus halophytocola]|uniref:Uracil-DNA glycosylase n=1 Tax=Algoriphagus halophytocola TaxID=2991499 RepID=A0ABY6MF60_9BACT|nr:MULTISPECIES: uracil-DNA glycosylase [unclassified Algoriphagus]UZD22431.1 uracil-DNA glycosylase [Algoriphagus sp. TR-M5]WBL43691.1 uracil-DNA glycosylase [Algoriphagus sp. TR-M9]